MRPLLSGILLLALLAPPGARAEDAFPYDTRGGREAGLLLVAGAMFAGGWTLDRGFEAHTLLDVREKDRAQVLLLDRCATGRWSLGANGASDWLVGLQIAAPAALAFDGGGSRQPDRVALMYAETMALSAGMAFLLKNAFDRTRPFVYNDDPAIPEALKQERTARKSFPSGHTANAFASMVFLATVFDRTNPDSPHRDLVWAGCLTSAAITGVLRVAAGRHFPSDVLAGAAIGSAAGWAVPRMHEVESSSSESGGPKSAVSIAWRVGF